MSAQGRLVRGRRRLAPGIALVGAVLVAACGGARPPATTAAHRWRPQPGTPPVDCQDHRLVPATHDVRVEQCRGGRGRACAELANEPHLREADWELARSVMRGACTSDRASSARLRADEGIRRDRVCSCAAYGDVLVLDPRTRFDLEGLDLLDEGCVEGNLDACDEADLIAEICRLDEGHVKSRRFCDVLRAQKRVPEPEPPPPVLASVRLPASLLGCFVATGAGEGSDAAASYCFADDRVSYRDASGPWDQRRVSWAAYPKDPELHALVVSEGGLEGEYLVTATPAGAVLRTGDVVVVLARAAASVTAEARALPHVEDVCRWAMRCAGAVDQQLRRDLPDLSDSDAPVPAPSTTLLACRRDAEMARRRVTPPPRLCDEPR